jgi:imidazolonepropionase-like amidohydrolase
VEKAISLVTRNAANVIGCGKRKGSVAVDQDADLILLKDEFFLDGVIAGGKWMRKNGKTLVREAF